MFLSVKINVQEQDFNEEKQITEDDCLCDRLNKSDNEIVDSDLSDWFRIKDKN